MSDLLSQFRPLFPQARCRKCPQFRALSHSVETTTGVIHRTIAQIRLDPQLPITRLLSLFSTVMMWGVEGSCDRARYWRDRRGWNLSPGCWTEQKRVWLLGVNDRPATALPWTLLRNWRMEPRSGPATDRAYTPSFRPSKASRDLTWQRNVAAKIERDMPRGGNRPHRLRIESGEVAIICMVRRFPAETEKRPAKHFRCAVRAIFRTFDDVSVTIGP